VNNIVDSMGNIVTVIAATESGVKIALTSKEKLDAFFKQHPSAKLEFVTQKGKTHETKEHA
jgi:hypothetical protein